RLPASRLRAPLTVPGTRGAWHPPCQAPAVPGTSLVHPERALELADHPLEIGHAPLERFERAVDTVARLVSRKRLANRSRLGRRGLDWAAEEVRVGMILAAHLARQPRDERPVRAREQRLERGVHLRHVAKLVQ